MEHADKEAEQQPGAAGVVDIASAGPRTREPGAAVLAYLFADRLVEADTLLRKGLQVPCSDAEVKMKQAAVVFLSVTYWSLRERGKLELELLEKRRRIGRDAQIIKPRLLEPAEDPTVLEALIADRLSSGKEFEDLRMQIVTTPFDIYRPFQQVIFLVQAEAYHCGLGELEMSGTAKAALLRRWGTFEPDCARISGATDLQERFEDVYERWEAFGANEPSMRELLLADVKSGLSGREAQGRGEGSKQW